MARQRSVDFWILSLQILLDSVLLYLSFCFAFFIRFHSGLFQVTRGMPSFISYAEVFPAATVVMLLVFKSMGLYVKREFGKELQLFQTIKAVSLGMFILTSLTFIYREVSYSRLLVVVAWLLGVFIILFGRFLIRFLRKTIYLAFKLHKNFLIIGAGECSKIIMQSLLKVDPDLYKVVGVLNHIEQEDASLTDYKISSTLPILGSIDQLPTLLTSQKIDEVILTVPGLEHKKIVEIILSCEKEMVNFRMVPDIFEILTTQVELENFHGITLLGLKQFPLEKAINRFYKRTIDILGASFGLIILTPLFLLLSGLIKKDSSGSVFYKQERIGQDGKHFMMIKFRTMKQNAEEKTGPVWAKEDDPRRTKIGAFLRQFNLDELPQLWNVLKADMSLVGPRPERPHFVNEFKGKIPRYMSRHRIKSGMTGWAQVNGLRGNTSILERIKYDLYYLENWSIWFDLRIILKTFFARQNAY